MKAILIDDEQMARTLLSGMLAEFCPEVQLLEQCADLPSGIKAIRKRQPDVVFLDIEMPGHSGLELLDFFNEDEINFSIIFVTAYQQYAIQAFKLSAVDYLLKPIDSDDLIQAVQLVNKQQHLKKFQVLKDNLNVQSSKKIAINTAHSIVFIQMDDILFFKADGAYTQVFINDGRMVHASKNLRHFEELTQGHPDFYRCHKSYVVNISHVTEYIKSDGGALKIKNHLIGVSAEKLNLVLERLR